VYNINCAKMADASCRSCYQPTDRVFYSAARGQSVPFCNLVCAQIYSGASDSPIESQLMIGDRMDAETMPIIRKLQTVYAWVRAAIDNRGSVPAYRYQLGTTPSGNATLDKVTGAKPSQFDSVKIEQLVEFLHQQVLAIAKLLDKRHARDRLIRDPLLSQTLSAVTQVRLEAIEKFLRQWIEPSTAQEFAQFDRPQLERLSQMVDRLAKTLDDHRKETRPQDYLLQDMPRDTRELIKARIHQRHFNTGRLLTPGRTWLGMPSEGHGSAQERQSLVSDYGVVELGSPFITVRGFDGRSIGNPMIKYGGRVLSTDDRAAQLWDINTVWAVQMISEGPSMTRDPFNTSSIPTITFFDVKTGKPVGPGRQILKLPGDGPIVRVRYVESPMEAPYFFHTNVASPMAYEPENGVATLCRLDVDPRTFEAHLVPVITGFYLEYGNIRRVIANVANTSAGRYNPHHMIVTLSAQASAPSFPALHVYRLPANTTALIEEGQNLFKLMKPLHLRGGDYQLSYLNVFVDSDGEVLLAVSPVGAVVNMYHVLVDGRRIWMGQMASSHSMAFRQLCITDSGRIYMPLALGEHKGYPEVINCEWVADRQPVGSVDGQDKDKDDAVI